MLWQGTLVCMQNNALRRWHDSSRVYTWCKFLGTDGNLMLGVTCSLCSSLRNSLCNGWLDIMLIHGAKRDGHLPGLCLTLFCFVNLYASTSTTWRLREHRRRWDSVNIDDVKIASTLTTSRLRQRWRRQHVNDVDIINAMLTSMWSTPCRHRHHVDIDVNRRRIESTPCWRQRGRFVDVINAMSTSTSSTPCRRRRHRRHVDVDDAVSNRRHVEVNDGVSMSTSSTPCRCRRRRHRRHVESILTSLTRHVDIDVFDAMSMSTTTSLTTCRQSIVFSTGQKRRSKLH